MALNPRTGKSGPLTLILMLAIVRNGIRFHVVLLVPPKAGASDTDKWMTVIMIFIGLSVS